MNMFTHTVTIYHKADDQSWHVRVINDVHVEMLQGEIIRKRGVESTSKLIAYIPIASSKGAAIEKGDVIYCGISPVTVVNKASDILHHKNAFLVTSAEIFDFGEGQQHIEVVAK